ncbi:MAG TPA: hypothetical protein VGM44_18960 [Polyangiaceae bacterium]
MISGLKLGWGFSLARGKAALFTAVFCAVGCNGKGVAGDCPDQPACGGDPSGVWEVQSECQFDVPKAPLTTSPIASAYMTPQSPALASGGAPPTNSGDWCSGLVYLPPSSTNTNPLAGIAFYQPPLDFREGNVTFTASDDPTQQLFQFTVAITSGPQLTHFTPACLQAYGANPSCDDLTAGLIAEGTSVNYQNPQCTLAADQGCDCSYTIGDTSGDSGDWRIIGNSIYLFNSPSGNPPQTMDYCVQGDTMTLSGKDGSHLNGSAGVRSMVLKKCGASGCGD